VEKVLEAKNIPTLRIDTDYSTEDMGQLKTRVEAFVELIKLRHVPI
jgi:benzoyl-CoA reductase/2-hydroxyglutaryl-CoA dehydratase subunit BcrC/BadD/HgdB